MESIEKSCCIITVSECVSDLKPISCSGVILNPKTGLVICNGLIFSRFMNSEETLPPDQTFLSPQSLNGKININLGFSELRDIDTNQCSYQTCNVAESNAIHQHQTTAELLMLVNCPEFKGAFLKIFKDADKWSFYGGEDDQDLIKDAEFISWFAILKAPGLTAANTGPMPWVNSSSLQKGLSVFACGSPFGSLCPDLFMGTLSRGIISNLAGEDNAVILTDARCLPGTEGGGLFIQRGDYAHLVGLIVSPLCWKSSEWIGLTLVCSLQVILRNIKRCMDIEDPLEEIYLHHRSIDFLPRRPTTHVGEYPTVALVDSGQFWGSGVVVSSKLVLTCRHVVNGKSSVTVKFYYKDRFHDVVGRVLFSTKESSPYDMAVVQLVDPVPEAVVPKLAKSFQPGEDVVVVGYGGLGRTCGPSLTCGILSKAISWDNQPVMLQTTCAVQAGASGGAVVRAHSGELLGIVSSNTRDFAAKVTYPHLNYSIPVTVLWPLLRGFDQTKDVSVFRSLDTTEEGIRKVWRLQSVRSKL